MANQVGSVTSEPEFKMVRVLTGKQHASYTSTSYSENHQSTLKHKVYLSY